MLMTFWDFENHQNRPKLGKKLRNYEDCSPNKMPKQYVKKT